MRGNSRIFYLNFRNIKIFNIVTSSLAETFYNKLNIYIYINCFFSIRHSPLSVRLASLACRIRQLYQGEVIIKKKF